MTDNKKVKNKKNQKEAGPRVDNDQLGENVYGEFDQKKDCPK